MKPLTLTLITLVLWVSTTLWLAAPACALNEMTLVGQYDGENENDRFGNCVTMGDFDDDGYEEFFIGASRWNNSMGKNYYYDWNGDWPNVPTWTFQGTIELNRYDVVDQNVGDVSGDGIVDLGLVEMRHGEPERFDLLFGSADFDSLADWSMWSAYELQTYGGSLDSCGDVNGDGGNDFIMYVWGNDIDEMRIYYGGLALDTIPDWVHHNPSAAYQSCQGLGDVNGDGYSDVLISGPNFDPPLLFFGGCPMDTIPDLVFYNYSVLSKGGGIGDVNGDGFNDFCIALKLPDSTSQHAYIYFGGPDVDNVPDVTLLDHWGGLESCYRLSHGDYNNDGYTDIANSTGDLFFGCIVYIYLGGPWFNPVPDALVTDWSVSQGFGEALASGDINGDGRDELLVGSPDFYYFSEQGRAYLYTGPEEWVDYGAGVEPEDLRHHPGWFTLDQNFPNPFNSNTSIHFEIGKPSTVSLTIYDLQGNRIKNLITSKDMLPGGYNVSWTGINEYSQPVSSGIYLLEMRVDQYRQVRKMVLLR